MDLAKEDVMMSTHAMKTIIAAVTLLATASLSTAAVAQADDDCTRYDRSDRLRCFHCLNRVWTGTGWRLVNTCDRWGYQR